MRFYISVFFCVSSICIIFDSDLLNQLTQHENEKASMDGLATM